MNYANYNGILSVIREWLPKLPEFDAFVGIPRSGCLPALFLALYRNKPFLTLQEFFLGTVPETGARCKVGEIKKVLVLDDTYFTGKSMKQAKEKIEIRNLHLDYDISYGVVFDVERENKEDNFYSAMVLPQPRCFEWNILAHDPIIRGACFDMDGVLCEAPTPAQNDDGPAYEAFLKNAKPKYLPSLPIRAIITCRLEKYRQLTQDWLKQHNVSYEKLVMMQYETAAERQQDGKYAEYKTRAYQEIKGSVFLEDEPNQAKVINYLTKMPVICVKDWSMLQ